LKLDDNLNVSINIKWLIQIVIATGGLVYGYLMIEQRILRLETSMEQHQEDITSLIAKHTAEEEAKMLQLQEQLKWYEKELNLNPFSILKRKK
tara:strand:- start:5863 stop:6141 length:279 start_codon:yes stop_codon:yes gene_type:complete